MSIWQRVEMALRRYAHRRGWLWSPSQGWTGVPFGRHGVRLVPVNARHAASVLAGHQRHDAAVSEVLDADGDGQRTPWQRAHTGRVSDTYVRLPADTTLAIADQLKAHGWDPEYVTDSEIQATFPDPDTGNAMTLSEFWLSWALIDGQLTYGVGDDIGAPWRKQLDVDADAPPEAVAAAADRVMHLLWHCDERDALSKLHQKYMPLSAMQTRMQELGRRTLVTPGMIRAALKPSGSWTP